MLNAWLWWRVFRKIIICLFTLAVGSLEIAFQNNIYSGFVGNINVPNAYYHVGYGYSSKIVVNGKPDYVTSLSGQYSARKTNRIRTDRRLRNGVRATMTFPIIAFSEKFQPFEIYWPRHHVRPPICLFSFNYYFPFLPECGKTANAPTSTFNDLSLLDI